MWVYVKERVKLIILAILYLLLFSGSTSPLFPYDYGWDSALFILVGKSLNRGKRLYADLFDHKGPVIFWIEAMGDRLGGYYGIFLVQIIFMFLTLLLMQKIFRLIRPREKNWLALLIFLVFLAYPFANGNLTEEFSLPFIILPLYLSFKKIAGNKYISKQEFFIFGICFGILAFIRLNNGVMIAGVVLFWIWDFVYCKEYKKLIGALLYGLGGILVISLPVCLIFLKDGTFDEMLYATFFYNFAYGEAGFKNVLSRFFDFKFLLRQGILYSPLVLSCIICLKYIKNKRLKKMVLLTLLINMLVLLYGKGYNHYFMISVPLIGINAGFFLEEVLKKKAVYFLGCILFAGYFALNVRIIGVNIYNNYISPNYIEQCSVLAENFKKIPDDEKNSILGYNIHSRCYLMGDVIPSYKYYTAQDAWAQNDPKILEEFYCYLENTPPAWLITEADNVSDRMEKILKGSYELKMEDNYCRYYSYSGGR